mmetsp:Transcript_104479/g.261943  ORF Transcript_104479/g.261943 Transcript_104479/m.261943 type:complete len:237 (+) Transcript_104479:82-792(+)
MLRSLALVFFAAVVPALASEAPRRLKVIKLASFTGNVSLPQNASATEKQAASATKSGETKLSDATPRGEPHVEPTAGVAAHNVVAVVKASQAAAKNVAAPAATQSAAKLSAKSSSKPVAAMPVVAAAGSAKGQQDVGAGAFKKEKPTAVPGTPKLAGPMPLRAPEQGFEGRDVQHVDSRTHTGDWLKEFGPNGPQSSTPAPAPSPPPPLAPVLPSAGARSSIAVVAVFAAAVAMLL